MHILIIIIILILIWMIFGARIRAWIGRQMSNFIANRTEDYIRRATGMPPREKKRKSHKTRESQGNDSRQQTSRRRSNYSGHSPIIPPEYAEDVEFTEIREFSQTDIEARFNDGSKVEYHESQVSDVEWVEIRSNEEERGEKKRRK